MEFLNKRYGKSHIMSETKQPSGPLRWLLNGTVRGRIAIFLWRRYPKAFTVDEINDKLRLISRSRIQQVLQNMYNRDVVDRKRRLSSRRGPNPYEYGLTPLLCRIFNDGFVTY